MASVEALSRGIARAPARRYVCREVGWFVKNVVSHDAVVEGNVGRSSGEIVGRTYKDSAQVFALIKGNNNNLGQDELGLLWLPCFRFFSLVPGVSPVNSWLVW